MRILKYVFCAIGMVEIAAAPATATPGHASSVKQIIEAIRSREPKELETLDFDRALLSETDDQGRDIISIALTKYDPTVLRALKLNGRDVNRTRPNSKHGYPQFAAVVSSAAVVRHLLASGMDPNYTDGTGRAPIANAAVSSRLDVVSLLLDYGGNPFSVDPQGNDLAALLRGLEGLGPKMETARTRLLERLKEETEAVAQDHVPFQRVSLVALLSSPLEWHSKKVSVVGYFVDDLDPFLFLTRDHADAFDVMSSLGVVRTARDPQPIPAYCDLHYIRVDGTFKYYDQQKRGYLTRIKDWQMLAQPGASAKAREQDPKSTETKDSPEEKAISTEK